MSPRARLAGITKVPASYVRRDASLLLARIVALLPPRGGGTRGDYLQELQNRPLLAALRVTLRPLFTIDEHLAVPCSPRCHWTMLTIRESLNRAHYTISLSTFYLPLWTLMKM